MIQVFKTIRDFCHFLNWVDFEVCVKGFSIYRAIHKNNNVEHGEVIGYYEA